MEIFEFIRQFPLKSFNKGEILLSEGQSLNTIFGVQSGFVKVTSLSESGYERVLWIAGPNNMVPAEQLFLTQGSLQFFYTALSDCRVFKIDKREFIDYTRQNPLLMTEIAKRLSVHYDDLLTRIDSVGQISVRNKLIYTLSYLAKRFSPDDVVDIYKLGLKLTHQDIAAMIGSTRETTSIELRKLLLSGGIAYDRNRFIINISKLESLQFS